MILDDLGNPFYWHENKEGKIHFNLPTGQYYSNVPIKKQLRFKPYGHKRNPKLPKGFLRNIQVYSHPNPHKASISIQKEFIIADPKFYNHKYRPCKTFTIGHELFHKLYHCKTQKERDNKYYREMIEMKCDEASRNFMLAHGWNPSQVRLACAMLLRGNKRKERIRKLTTDSSNCFRR